MKNKYKQTYKKPYPRLEGKKFLPHTGLLLDSKRTVDFVELASSGAVEENGKTYYFETWIVYQEVEDVET